MSMFVNVKWRVDGIQALYYTKKRIRDIPTSYIMATQLAAQTREKIGRQAKQLRKMGLIPAVLYGHETKSQNIAVEYEPFLMAFKQAGGAALVDLSVGGKDPAKVLIQDYSIDPLTDRFTHVDFYKVNMNEEVHATIPLVFIGESAAVKALGGLLTKSFDEVEVVCLPGDLVSGIEVDISTLATFSDILHLSDIKLPTGIELVLKTNEVLAKVIPPRSDEELASLSDKVEAKVEDVKVATEEKKKEKEAAEAAVKDGEKTEKKEEKK